MAVSLLGYFGYVGVAFTAIMALLFSLFVNSKRVGRDTPLSELGHYANCHSEQ